ncbi:Uncharacterised protein [Legionella hackeliae]|nr:hypothetical protein Lhac_2854 [Legionella hackeliae]STX49905.1 Uncharacterised protein [Legionella hackeliae]
MDGLVQILLLPASACPWQVGVLETVLNPMPTCLGLSEAGRSVRDRVESYAYLPWLV